MSNYWQKRFQAVEEMNNKRAKEVVQSITPAFDQAQAQIEKEINAWYARFAKNNQISLQEAKKLLNTKELKEFRWDVQEYIKYGRQNAIDQQWMKQLENASARFHVSRLEALKIRTQNAAERAFGNELDQLDQMAARLYMDDYYHTAYEIQRGLGIGFDVAQIDQRKLDNLISKPWTADKMTFSDRVWKSKTQLIDSLHTELTQMCVLGKSPDQAINNIAKRMNVSKNQAGRLVMTESAYFASAAQKDCFNDLDVEKFEIVATLDSHTSEICQQMDGQVFDMKDFQAGVTAPPFHVWCRSCTCPWFPDNDDGTRIARGADGKTYHVPANMKYQDWKDHFVDKIKDPADWLRPVDKDDIVEVLTLKDKIQKVKDDISTNGGTITEDHIKEAGKAVHEELIAIKNPLKVKLDEAQAEYDSSDIKKQIDEALTKRDTLRDKYKSMSHSDSERKTVFDEWEKSKVEYLRLHSSKEAIEYRNKILNARRDYEGTWETNADELKTKLGEFRNMGIGNHDMKKTHYSNRGTLRDLVTTAYDHYPSDWVDASVKKGRLSITKVSRGFYNGYEIAISGDYVGSQIRTAFHELGHRFEDVVKGIYQAEDIFYKRRTAGEKLEWLGSGYAKYEKTRRDDFLHAYMGKEYPDNFYELCSMGFEYAYTNPTHLWEDEDFAQFIYGILALY